jgi:predicted  nucleic acid-binding Zn-ribbon protein
VDKIHSCLNHCILYHKEYEFNTKCPVCGVSRYKRSYNHVYADTMKKNVKTKNKSAIGPESVNDEADPDKEDVMKRKIPALVMWYLPLIGRETCVLQP